MIRLILLDIEGTTTDIQFVHQVLFPYSAKHLPNFVRSQANHPEVQKALQAVKQTVQHEQGTAITDLEAIETLLQWIQADRKHPALKLLQGLIWREGYVNLAYQGHVYDDVPLALRQWQDQNIQLGIYSSGSVEAQKLLFEYSTAGDLSRYFQYHFDTAVGGKREVESYQNIIQQVQLSPLEILFLSDVCEELDAARLAGLHTVQVLREGTTSSQRHETVPHLLAVHLPNMSNSTLSWP